MLVEQEWYHLLGPQSTSQLPALYPAIAAVISDAVVFNAVGARYILCAFCKCHGASFRRIGCLVALGR